MAIKNKLWPYTMYLIQNTNGHRFIEIPPDEMEVNQERTVDGTSWYWIKRHRKFDPREIMAITPAEMQDIVASFQSGDASWNGGKRYVEFVNTIDAATLDAYCNHHNITIDKSQAIPYTYPVDDEDAFMDDDDDFGERIVSGTWTLSNGIQIHSIAYANNGLSWIQLYSVEDSPEGKSTLEEFKKALDNWRLTRLKRESKDKILKVKGYSVTPNSFEKTRWDQVILPEDLKDDIQSAVFSFFESENVYKGLGLSWQRGILLAGPPGNGKTMLCRTIASEADVPFFNMAINRNTGDGQLGYAFDHARHIAPAIICLEDIDRLFQSNSQSTLVYFLNLLDGIYKSNNGVLVIATANHPEDLDQALVQRPSRFDRVFRIEVPAQEERFAFLKAKDKNNQFFSDEALQDIAKKTHGMSMAFIQEIVTQAHLNAVFNGGAPGDEELKDAYQKLQQQNRQATKASKEQGQGTTGFSAGF